MAGAQPFPFAWNLNSAESGGVNPASMWICGDLYLGPSKGLIAGTNIRRPGRLFKAVENCLSGAQNQVPLPPGDGDFLLEAYPQSTGMLGCMYLQSQGHWAPIQLKNTQLFDQNSAHDPDGTVPI